MRYIEISNLERDLFSNNSVIQVEYAFSLRFFVIERLFLKVFCSEDLNDRFIAFENEIPEVAENYESVYNAFYNGDENWDRMY